MSISLVLLVLLGACSGDNAAEKEQKNQTEKTSEKNLANKSQVVDGLKITIKKQEENEKVEGKKKENLYTFTIEGENASSVKKGLGSIDFVLKTKDKKEVKLDDSLATFGNELKSGEKLSGKVSFATNKAPDKLVYKPNGKELAEWSVNENE